MKPIPAIDENGEFVEATMAAEIERLRDERDEYRKLMQDGWVEVADSRVTANLRAQRDALRNQLRDIQAQADDKMEYVLAIENQRLRAALIALADAAGKGVFCGACLTARGLHEPNCELVMAREELAAYQENIEDGLDHTIAYEAELKAERDEARAALDDVSTAIGSNEFMDPPDGGSVTLAEQVRRMRAALAEAQKFKDAVMECKDDTWECPQCGHSETWWWESNAEYAVREIDAAIAKGKP